MYLEFDITDAAKRLCLFFENTLSASSRRLQMIYDQRSLSIGALLSSDTTAKFSLKISIFNALIKLPPFSSCVHVAL